MDRIKSKITMVDKNMSDIPRWVRRTSAISSGIITGALIAGACGPQGPENQQTNTTGEDGNNNTSGEQSSSTENFTQEQIAQRTFDNFVSTHPEYKDRKAGVVNFVINGIDASTVVFETTETEKAKISERKYVVDGDEVTPFVGAIVWTKETDFDGNEKWVRLAGVQFQNEGDTTNTIYTVWYISPYEDYTKIDTNVDFKRKVFAFNSNDDEYAYWPQVNPPTKIVWSEDMTQTDPSKFEFWNGNDPFMLPVKQVVEGGSKSLFAPVAIESLEPVLSTEIMEKFDKAGIKLEDLGTPEEDGLHIHLENREVVISYEDLSKNSHLGQNNVWQYRNDENTQVLYAFDKENKKILETSIYIQLDRMDVEGYIRVDDMAGLDELARITEMLSMPFPENTYFPPYDQVDFDWGNRQNPNYSYPFGELPDGMTSFLRIANYVIVGEDTANGRPYESVAVLQHAYNADDGTFDTIKYVKDITDPESESPISIQIVQEKSDGSGILLPHIGLLPEDIAHPSRTTIRDYYKGGNSYISNLIRKWFQDKHLPDEMITGAWELTLKYFK